MSGDLWTSPKSGILMAPNALLLVHAVHEKCYWKSRMVVIPENQFSVHSRNSIYPFHETLYFTVTIVVTVFIP